MDLGKILEVLICGLVFGVIALTQPLRAVLLCASVFLLLWVSTLKFLRYYGPVPIYMDPGTQIGVTGDRELPIFYGDTKALLLALGIAAIIWAAGRTWLRRR